LLLWFVALSLEVIALAELPSVFLLVLHIAAVSLRFLWRTAGFAYSTLELKT